MRLECLRENFQDPPLNQAGKNLPDMGHMPPVVGNHTQVSNTNIWNYLLVHSAANENIEI